MDEPPTGLGVTLPCWSAPPSPVPASTASSPVRSPRLSLLSSILSKVFLKNNKRDIGTCPASPERGPGIPIRDCYFKDLFANRF